MTKIKLFSSECPAELQQEVNNFLKGKFLVNVSYSTNIVGYSIIHYCCVTYMTL